MLIVRKVKPDTLDTITPIDDHQPVAEETVLRIGKLGLQLAYQPTGRTRWRRFPPMYDVDPSFLVMDEDSAVYAAYEDETFIGFAAVTSSPTGWAEVIDLRIDMPHRRQGAGRMLLDKCAAFAQKRGLHGLRVACTDTNPGMCQFLEHTGFALHGFDHMVLAMSPEERQKPKSRRTSLLYFYRNEKG